MGTKNTKREPYRLRSILISADNILDWIQAAVDVSNGQVMTVRLPKIDDLPDDVRVHHVQHAGYHLGNMIAIVVEHPSFEPIPPGEMIPAYLGALTLTDYTVAVGPDGIIP